MNRITKAALIENLNAVKTDDPEEAHARADELILAALPIEVQNAYKGVIARAKWWSAA